MKHSLEGYFESPVEQDFQNQLIEPMTRNNRVWLPRQGS